MELTTKRKYVQHIECAKDTKTMILHHTGMSEDDYLDYQFEIGYQMACNFYEEETFLQALLQNPDLKYWSWFRMQWNIEEQNFWKANKWMVLEKPKYFSRIKNPLKSFRKAWHEEMAMLAMSAESHHRLHHHLLDVNAYLNLKTTL